MEKKTKRRLNVFKYEGEGNSLCQWHKAKSPLRVTFNFIIITLCKYMPSLRMKNRFYRMLGMKVGKNVSIAQGVMFDFFFPELIEIGDNSIVGYSSTILAHEFLIREWRTGKVEIGKNVMIGALVLVMPGVKIDDNAQVSAYSLVNKDVENGSLVGGIPIKRIR
jgi:acetyltransferase-like isoleucine patch superfamily enzyme